jgi:hypothetical protein
MLYRDAAHLLLAFYVLISKLAPGKWEVQVNDTKADSNDN